MASRIVVNRNKLPADHHLRTKKKMLRNNYFYYDEGQVILQRGLTETDDNGSFEPRTIWRMPQSDVDEFERKVIPIFDKSAKTPYQVWKEIRDWFEYLGTPEDEAEALTEGVVAGLYNISPQGTPTVHKLLSQPTMTDEQVFSDMDEDMMDESSEDIFDKEAVKDDELFDGFEGKDDGEYSDGERDEQEGFGGFGGFEGKDVKDGIEGKDGFDGKEEKRDTSRREVTKRVQSEYERKAMRGYKEETDCPDYDIKEQDDVAARWIGFVRAWTITQNPAGGFPQDIVHLWFFCLRDWFLQQLQATQRERRRFRWSIGIFCDMHSPIRGEMQLNVPFDAWSGIIYENTDVSVELDRMRDIIIEKIDQYILRGSGWRLERINEMLVRQTKLKRTNIGGSFIPLPKELKKLQCLLNIKTVKTSNCFGCSVLAQLHPLPKGTRNQDRETNYTKYKGELKFPEGTSFDEAFPCSGPLLAKFEKLNNVAIYIYEYTKKGLNIVRGYDEKMGRIDQDRIIHLIFLGNRATNEDLSLNNKPGEEQHHYVLIKNLDALMRYQGNFTTDNRGWAKRFCRRCLGGFEDVKKYTDHIVRQDCLMQENNFKCTRLHLVDEEKAFVKYDSETKKHKEGRFPAVIYGDFESILVPSSANPANTILANKKIISHHVASGWGLVAVFSDDFRTLYNSKLSGNRCAIPKFIKHNYRVPSSSTLSAETEMKAASEMLKTLSQIRSMLSYTLSNKRYKHLRKYGEEPLIPVLFHNLRGYDAHILMQAIGANQSSGNFSVLPLTAEKYISFEWNGFIFKDSNSFLHSSLEQVTNILHDPPIMEGQAPEQKQAAVQGIAKFKITKQYWTDVSRLNQSALSLSGQKVRMTEVDIPLLCLKGSYPYEAVTNFQDFDRTDFWTKEEFYTSLREEKVDDESFERGKHIFEKYCKTRGDYHDLYNINDSLQLADVFENFRDICLATDGLDPVMYYTLPGYAWDAAFKFTGATVQFFNNKQVDMACMIEKGIIGGISITPNRYSRANHPYLPRDGSAQVTYDPTKPHKYLMCLDANGLYTKAGSMPLPKGNFRWVEGDEFAAITISAKAVQQHMDGFDFDNSPFGEQWEVDLHCPDHLHNWFNDLPLAPEKASVKDSELSSFCKGQKCFISSIDEKQLESFDSESTQKLIPRLTDKTEYVCGLRLLHLYVQLGMVITKVRRILRYDQAKWLEPYMKGCAERRKAAKDDFTKQFEKNKPNDIYGKTIENPLKRCNVKVVKSSDMNRAQYLVSQPSFESWRFITADKSMMAINLRKTKIEFKTPRIVGCAILDNSKWIMYNFYYNVLKKKYGSKLKLMMMDTDSTLVEIETDDVYRDINDDDELRSYLDMSPYVEKSAKGTVIEHILNKFPNIAKDAAVNKGVGGKFKDDVAKKLLMISEVVCLRAKMYSILGYNASIKMRAKGVPRVRMTPETSFLDDLERQVITHRDYYRCLFPDTSSEDKKLADSLQRAKYRKLNHYRHEIYTEDMEKISLSCYDDKFYWLDSTNKLAYGHYKIKQISQAMSIDN
jgi:hypothetical protein